MTPDVLTGFLDEVASAQPVPAGGSVAAAAVAMAAALLHKAARLSGDRWAEASQAVERADRLHQQAAALIEADADAYRALQAAWRSGRGLQGPERDRIVGPARSLAVDVPLAIARSAAEVVELAVTAAAEGNPNLRGDAMMAGLLAAAAAEGAGALVAINLAGDPADPRVLEAERLAAGARRRAAELAS